MARRRVSARRAVAGTALVVAVWAFVAYLAAPFVWSELESGSPPRAMLTTTPLGIPGDPLNFGLVGSEAEIVAAFHAIGWRPADSITLKSAVEIGLSVVLDRPYPDAPVSNLVYEGRRQDLAFEKEDGKSAGRRHHARLWKVETDGADDRPLWLGTVSYDRDAGLSHDTLQITHHIAPDLDAERDALIGGFDTAGLLAGSYPVDGVGPTQDGRNGGGDRYFTDGKARVGVLKER
ncbi:MAG: LssY C-terminal domain-containing protein [Pseudomonadota bacterium]